MKTKEPTQREIRERALAAVMKELGPEGYVRFVQEFWPGKGDYTKERRKTVCEISPQQLEQMLVKRRARRARAR